MHTILHETCPQYIARRLSEGWKIVSQVSQDGFNVILQSPEGIIRTVDLRDDTETLRPDASGDEKSIDNPADDPHWNLVDEASADDWTTRIGNMSSADAYQRDLYNLPASSGSGTINFIKIYFRHQGTDGFAKPSLKSNSTVTDGTEVNLSGSWTTSSQQWNTNPADSEAWEWADINALQIGVSLKRTAPNDAYCTQVYVEVDYTPAVAVGRSFGFIFG